MGILIWGIVVNVFLLRICTALVTPGKYDREREDQEQEMFLSELFRKTGQ